MNRGTMLTRFPTVALGADTSNPRWQGTCADPYILPHDGLFYAYGTSATPETPDAEGRHFVLLRSADLVHWEQLPGPLIPHEGLENLPHWAPEVAAHNGSFWMFYSAARRPGDDTQHRLRVARADHPAGPFIESGRLLLPREEFTIDAHPFRDPKSGQWYLFFCRDTFGPKPGTGIAVAPLAETFQSTLTPPRDAILPSADWHISRRNRQLYGQTFPLWYTVEGASVLFHEGLYYCFYSGGNWQDETYGISCAVAEHPLGPWDDTASADGPLVLRTEPYSSPHPLIGPGHNSLLTPPGSTSTLCVYHAWNRSLTDRQLCISPLEWVALR